MSPIKIFDSLVDDAYSATPTSWLSSMILSQNKRAKMTLGLGRIKQFCQSVAARNYDFTTENYLIEVTNNKSTMRGRRLVDIECPNDFPHKSKAGSMEISKYIRNHEMHFGSNIYLIENITIVNEILLQYYQGTKNFTLMQTSETLNYLIFWKEVYPGSSPIVINLQNLVKADSSNHQTIKLSFDDRYDNGESSIHIPEVSYTCLKLDFEIKFKASDSAAKFMNFLDSLIDSNSAERGRLETAVMKTEPNEVQVSELLPKTPPLKKSADSCVVIISSSQLVHTDYEQSYSNDSDKGVNDELISKKTLKNLIITKNYSDKTRKRFIDIGNSNDIWSIPKTQEAQSQNIGNKTRAGKKNKKSGLLNKRKRVDESELKNNSSNNLFEPILNEAGKRSRKNKLKIESRNRIFTPYETKETPEEDESDPIEDDSIMYDDLSRCQEIASSNIQTIMGQNIINLKDKKKRTKMGAKESSHSTTIKKELQSKLKTRNDFNKDLLGLTGLITRTSKEKVKDSDPIEDDSYPVNDGIARSSTHSEDEMNMTTKSQNSQFDDNKNITETTIGIDDPLNDDKENIIEPSKYDVKNLSPQSIPDSCNNFKQNLMSSLNHHRLLMAKVKEEFKIEQKRLLNEIDDNRKKMTKDHEELLRYTKDKVNEINERFNDRVEMINESFYESFLFE